eukprot:g4560.t1
MAEISVSPSRELHVPKNREGLMDEKALKRANRLAGVGQSVASMDLKAVAETYKSQAGSSGIEAAAAAAAALNAALKDSSHVMANRNDRLAEDTATKRAIREERAAAAASRSDLLTEAVYSTHLRSKPEEGPNLISFIWGGIGIGKLVCISMVGLVIGLGALSLALLSVFGGDLATKVTCAAILAVVALGLVSAALTPIVAKVNAFFFIQSICSFSISGASFYFFTDGHFAALNMKPGCFILACVCNLVSCVVFTRTNVRLGISDKFFVLASDAVQMVVMEIAWLPNMLLMSQLCPKGCEATMFALLAGMGNLGANLGNYFGAFLLKMLGVQPTGEPNETAQFENLWLAAVVSAIAPMIPLALILNCKLQHVVFKLIPNISQKDPIKGLTSSSAGSPLSRFLEKYFGIEDIPSDDSTQELENMVSSADA